MQASDFEITARGMGRVKKELYDCNCTGRSFSQVSEDCDRNFWMYAKQAQAYGIIDGIVAREDR